MYFCPVCSVSRNFGKLKLSWNWSKKVKRAVEIHYTIQQPVSILYECLDFVVTDLLSHCIGFSYVVLDSNHGEKSSDWSRFVTRNETKDSDALDYPVTRSSVFSNCGPPWTSSVLSSNLLLWQKYETSSLQLREWHFRWLQYSYDGGTGLCLHGDS